MKLKWLISTKIGWIIIISSLCVVFGILFNEFEDIGFIYYATTGLMMLFILAVTGIIGAGLFFSLKAFIKWIRRYM